MCTRSVVISSESEPGIHKFIANSDKDGDSMKVAIATECRKHLTQLIGTKEEPRPRLSFERWQQEGDMWRTTIDTDQGPYYIEAVASR